MTDRMHEPTELNIDPAVDDAAKTLLYTLVHA